jgi:type IV secretion system protein VirD4
VIRHLLADPARAGVFLLVLLLALAFARWAFLPARHVPRFRVMTMRLRIRMRLHPGRGFAMLPELWFRWGRLASYRESGRARPVLPRSHRMIRPSSHAIYLGRAHYRHKLWQSIQENILIIGRSRSGKSGWLAKAIIRFGGAVVSLTTKPDLFRRTSGLRQRRGRPVLTFDPQGIGGARTRSTLRYDPISGCQAPSVAMRRGTAFTDAVRTKGTESGDFWSEQAAVQMPAMFCAAALAGFGLHPVYDWVVGGDTRLPERILRANGRRTWAKSVAQMRGAADKTGATVRMVLTAALKFLEDPELAACVTPGPGENFDIAEFLRLQGALYIMADPRNDSSPVASVTSCLVNEIHWTACQIAGSSPGERIDPPLLLQVDEATKTCPGLAVPSLLADSGGRGITMIIACQGLAQIEERWGKPATRTVLDTANQMYVSGIQDPDTLEMASRLCDTATYQVRGKAGETADYPVATPGMIRRLPRRRALILRGDCAPVITHLPMAWNDWRYRLAKLQGRATADLTALPATVRHSAVMAPAVPASIPEPAAAELATVGAAGSGPSAPAAEDGAAYPWEQR